MRVEEQNNEIPRSKARDSVVSEEGLPPVSS